MNSYQAPHSESRDTRTLHRAACPICNADFADFEEELVYCPECGSLLAEASQYQEPEDTKLQASILKRTFAQNAAGVLSLRVSNNTGEDIKTLEVNVECEYLQSSPKKETKRFIKHNAAVPVHVNIKPMEAGSLSLKIYIVFWDYQEEVNVFEAEDVIIDVQKEEQKPQSIVINNSRNIADGSEAYGVDISGDIHVHVGSESNDAEQGEANQSQGAGWQSLPLRWSAESVRLFRKKHEVPYVQDKKGRKDIGTEAHAAWLVLSRPRAGVRFKSSLHFKDTLCMGRDPGADVTCIPEEHVDPHSRSSYISRRHLTLRVSDEVCTLEDQSTNGTWVDKEMIHCQAVQLRSNQVINLGGLLYFKYEEFRDLASMKSRLWEWQLSRHSMNTPQVSLTTVKQEIKSLPISAVRLKRLGGEALSCQYLLVIRELEIGSDKANALFLDDESIAAQHAKLLLQDNRLFLLDLGSKTGTRLNGELLDPHRAIGLGQGDRIQLGRLEGFIHFVGPFVQ